MVGMGVGDDDAEQRLAERVDARAQRAGAGARQRRVDDDDAVGAFEDVRVDGRAAAGRDRSGESRARSCAATLRR